jgi:hypothetical protein
MGICMGVWENADKIAAVCVVAAAGLGARSILGRWNRKMVVGEWLASFYRRSLRGP